MPRTYPTHKELIPMTGKLLPHFALRIGFWRGAKNGKHAVDISIVFNSIINNKVVSHIEFLMPCFAKYAQDGIRFYFPCNAFRSCSYNYKSLVGGTVVNACSCINKNIHKRRKASQTLGIIC